MHSTMQDHHQLTTTSILRHGAEVHGDSEIITFQEGGTSTRANFSEVAGRAERLAAALHRLGIGEGDTVGTFAWNNQAHMEAYLAVPSMGAVLHTLNIRLFSEQLTYVINHGEDRVIIVDVSVIPLLAKVVDDLQTVEHFIVVGAGDASGLRDVLRYEDLLAAEEPGFAWPDLDERAAAAMCYTSGTTGDPKGVVYSHRSIVLHSLAEWGQFGLRADDRLLTIVPMFHVNAWGLPYTGWWAGLDFVMPDRFLQPEPLIRMIADEKVTISVGVPTVWNAILAHADEHGADFSSIREVFIGGAAVPRSLMERFEERHGLRIIQAWGMTETSPIGTVAYPPKDASPEQEMDYRAKTGRIVPGVELRIVSPDGEPLPWDGEAVGEIEVRGPWIAESYHKVDAPDKFRDGWLRTGDAGIVDSKGFVQITDRTKDVIKSGGEWISSLELEDAIMSHEAVSEAAVVGVPDERWDERPLACVVLKEGTDVGVEDLKTYLEDRVAKWWIPERWTLIDEVPKTSVGKFDKKVLRAQYADEEFEVTKL